MDNRTEGTPAIVVKMQTLRANCSKTEQNVLDCIIANPEQIIRLSVADLADLAGVSDASVVRACQKLGFTGYYELKLALAQDIATPLNNRPGEVKAGDDPSTIMDRVFTNAIYTLQFTHSTANKIEDIVKAANMIHNANRVLIFAFGNSSSIAYDFQHKLMRIGINGMALSDPHLQVISGTQLGEMDVVFAISHSGSSKDIIDGVRVAKKTGAKIITLSNLGTSPLSKEADVHLHTASEETNFLIRAQASRVAQLVIIDTIYSIISVNHIDNLADHEFHILEALKSKKY